MLSSILLIKRWDQILIFGGQNLEKDRPLKNKKYTKNQNYINKITYIKEKYTNMYLVLVKYKKNSRYTKTCLLSTSIQSYMSTKGNLMSF